METLTKKQKALVLLGKVKRTLISVLFVGLLVGFGYFKLSNPTDYVKAYEIANEQACEKSQEFLSKGDVLDWESYAEIAGMNYRCQNGMMLEADDVFALRNFDELINGNMVTQLDEYYAKY